MARREHSYAELLQKLHQSEVDDDALRSLIDTLQREGLQSDERFSEAFVHARVNRGYGPVRIQQELKDKGVDESLITSALQSYSPDWQDLARQVRNKRFGTGPVTDFKERARQSRFLQYRGFTHEQIKRTFDGE